MELFNQRNIATTKAERTRQKILETAIKEFARSGYDNVTTKDIAKAAGVSEGAIFRYFKSKKELMDEAIMPAIKGMIPNQLNRVTDRFLKDHELKFRDFLDSFYQDRYRFVLANYEALKIYYSRMLFNLDEQEKFKEMIFEIESASFVRLVKYFQSSGEINESVDPRDVVFEIVEKFVASVLRIKILNAKQNDEKKRIINGVMKVYGREKE